MKNPLKIGQKEYKYKKDAIAYYKNMLNSYNFGNSLSDDDYDDLIDLLNYDYANHLVENENSEEFEKLQNNQYALAENDETAKKEQEELEIEDIRVAKVQFNTKCFEIIYSDNTSQYISYLMIINNYKYNPEKLFNIACRNSVHGDIHSVKQEYFDKNSVKGQVKCQETDQLLRWTELVVDHRQPNTFSMIVERFKEMNRLELKNIEYILDEQNNIVFKDQNLMQEFKKFHKEKASLRIVGKECNSSRSALARIKKTTKDLTIK